MSLQLYIYFGCALAGLVYNWTIAGKKLATRPTAVRWAMDNWLYVLTSAGMTAGCALFFLPETLGVNANAAAFAFGITGGATLKTLVK